MYILIAPVQSRASDKDWTVNDDPHVNDSERDPSAANKSPLMTCSIRVHELCMLPLPDVPSSPFHLAPSASLWLQHHASRVDDGGEQLGRDPFHTPDPPVPPTSRSTVSNPFSPPLRLCGCNITPHASTTVESSWVGTPSTLPTRLSLPPHGPQSATRFPRPRA